MAFPASAADPAGPGADSAGPAVRAAAVANYETSTRPPAVVAGSFPAPAAPVSPADATIPAESAAHSRDSRAEVAGLPCSAAAGSRDSGGERGGSALAAGRGELSRWVD